MQKILLFSVVMVLFKLNSAAQTVVEFVPSGGYTFSDKVNFYDAYGRLDGAANWGGSLLFNFNRRFGLELMYNRVNADYGIYDYGPRNQSTTYEKGKAQINYIMAGPIQYFYIPGSSIRPFVGALAGAAFFSPEPQDYSSNTKFAWGVQAGANFNVTPRVGFRLSARLLSPVESGDFYFGTFGNGSGYGGYSTIYQFGFNAGVIIGIGRILPRPQRIIIHRPQPRRYYRYYP